MMFLKLLKKLFFAQVAFSALATPETVAVPRIPMSLNPRAQTCFTIDSTYANVCQRLNTWDNICEESYITTYLEFPNSEDSTQYMQALDNKFKEDEQSLQHWVQLRDQLKDLSKQHKCTTHESSISCSSPLESSYKPKPGSCLSSITDVEVGIARAERSANPEKEYQALAAHTQLRVPQVK